MEYNDLFIEAVKASENAYCRYSGFRVGAALLSDDGRIFTGCNIENVSYSLTVCAERTAVFKAVSEGVMKFKAIAVAGSKNDDFLNPCVPCGACLQVLSQFCGKDFPVILSDGIHKLSDFLPYGFSEEN
ncbi:MAG: cytidine deaminase, partial [Ruminococcus sp.]|nr:cytidine deaminase [Ruminococcus sp.]